MRRLSLITLSLITATGLTAFSSAPVQTARETPPGEGVICAWAIYTVVAEVVDRCPTNTPTEMKAELRRSVDRLDAYVLANSEITQEEFDQFKREQGSVGRPEAELCQAEAAVETARAIADVSVDDLRTSIDALTARPGEPTWGTCL